MMAWLRYLRPVSDMRYWLGFAAVVIGIIHTSWGIGGSPASVEPVQAAEDSLAAVAAVWLSKLPAVMTVTGLFMMPIGLLFMAIPHIERRFGIQEIESRSPGDSE